MSDLNEFLEDFTEHLRASGISPNTLRAYRGDVRFLGQHFRSLEELNRQDSFRDLRLLLHRDYSPRTAARRWIATRAFMKFCLEMGYLESSPIFSMRFEPANQPRRIKRQLGERSLEMVCEAPDRLRDRALLWFLYSTGARPSELCRYGTFRNLDLAAGEFRIGDRVTFLCQRARILLEGYLAERGRVPTLDEAIFLDRHEQPVQEMYLYGLFGQAAGKLGWRGSVGELRDSLAIRLLSKGATLREVQYMLGFKSAKSVEPFLEVAEAAD